MSKNFLVISFFVIFIFCLISNLAASNKFYIKADFGFSEDWGFVSNDDVGFWGFIDENISEKQVFNGYFYGMDMGFKISKSFDMFLDMYVSQASLLMGNAGHNFKGMSVWDANPSHDSQVSPTLPYDIYFISKATIGRVGFRYFYQINKFLEPNIGFAFGVVPYQIAFGNKDGSKAYSDIIFDIGTIYSLIFGFDFNFYSLEQKIMSLCLFFEVGGTATKPSTVMNNWIWENWTYHAQFPVVPSFRFGISLGF